MGRKTRGRRKIEIKKIENEDARVVCFSKRRTGLFKKACDLATLTAARILVIVFSPAGKAYAFGSSNIEKVINYFLTGERPSGGHGALERLHAAAINDLNARYMQLMDAAETSKKTKLWLEARIATLVAENHLCASLKSIESLGVLELEQLVFEVQKVKTVTEMKTKEYLTVNASTLNTSQVVNLMQSVNHYPVGNSGFNSGLY